MGSDDNNSDLCDSGLKGYDAYEVTLGDHLRGERATSGKSLLDVQRDLRIRATYIAAIENCDCAVFPNPGFVAGYVKSYARYLKLDPEEIYERFCHDSGFTGINEGLQARRSADSRRIVATGPLKVSSDDPLSRSIRTPASDLRPGLFERLSVSAIGSLVVLALLVAGVGYGGYRVLQNIQRVTIAPVDQRPDTLAAVTGLAAPGLGLEEVALTDVPVEQSTRDTDLARLYQPRELEIPVVESRDGPIVDIDPRQAGLLSGQSQDEVDRLVDLALTAAETSGDPDIVVREPAGVPTVHVVARQPAWIRVYEDGGSVLFEKILDTGEVYSLPKDAEAPLLRAGNAGAVYLMLNDDPYGPIGTGASVAKRVSLLPDVIREEWPQVSDPPEVILETVSALALPAAPDQ